MVVVEAVVAEGVAPQIGRGDEAPVGADSGQVARGGEERAHVAGGAGEVLGEHRATDSQLFEGQVPFEQGDVAPGVMAEAGDEFDPVGELHEIVVGPERERFGLHRRFLFRRQDDDRQFPEAFIGPQLAKDLKPVDLGHHQIEEDTGRGRIGSHGEGRARIAAVMEIEGVLSGQHASDRLADDRLVIDEQDHAATRSGRGERDGGAKGLRDVHGVDSLSTDSG